jgi:hypothetical protein
MDMEEIDDVSFSDVSGHWAEEDIMLSGAIGWVRGYPDGTFRPNQPLTRAEFMSLVNRMLERVPEIAPDVDNAKETHPKRDALGMEILDADDKPIMETIPLLHWPDNADKEAWYYTAVQEATNSHFYEYKVDEEDEFLTAEGLAFPYETWTETREHRDWAQFEKEWSTANSASNPGEVFKPSSGTGLPIFG